jgi:hypothetical protein
MFSLSTPQDIALVKPDGSGVVTFHFDDNGDDASQAVMRVTNALGMVELKFRQGGGLIGYIFTPFANIPPMATASDTDVAVMG